jgi:hypothetical protein
VLATTDFCLAVPDPSGGFWAAYLERRGGGVTERLFVQKVDRDGRWMLSAEGISVCPGTVTQQLAPDIVSDGRGGAWLAWQATARGETREAIWLQHFDGQGQAQFPDPGVRICTETSRQRNPKLLPDAGTGVFVIWEDDRMGTIDLYSQRFGATGKPYWEPSGKPVVIAVGNQRNPRAFLAPDGSLVVGWEDDRKGSTALYGQKIRPDGPALWTTNGVNFFGQAELNAEHTSIFPDGMGGLAAVVSATGTGTRQNDLFYCRISRSGEPSFSTPKLLNDLPDNQSMPHAALIGAEAQAVWVDYREGQANLYAQQIDLLTGVGKWGQAGEPVCTAGGEQTRFRTAQLNYRGEQLIVWEDHRAAPARFYAQKLNRLGQPAWSANGLPLASCGGELISWQVVPDAQDGAWLVWVSENDDEATRVKYLRIDRNGKQAGPIEKLASETDRNPVRIQHVTIKPGFANDAYVVWEDDRNGRKNTDIFLQRLDRHAHPLWQINGLPVCTAPGLQAAPRILPVRNGVYVVWLDRRESDDDLYMQFVDTAGRIRWGLNGLPLCRAPRSQSEVTLVRSEHERAIIVWTDGRSYSTQDFDLFIQIVDTTGACYWGENGVPVVVDAASQSNPAMSTDHRMGANLVWMDGRTGKNNIFIQHYNWGGLAQWKETGYRVVASNNHQRYPQIYTDIRQNSFIVWADDRYGADNTKIFIQKVDPTGASLWGTSGVQVCKQYGRQSQPRLIPDGEGGVIVIWLDQRHEQQAGISVFGQRFNARGEALWESWGVSFGQGLRMNTPFGIANGPDGEFLLSYGFQTPPVQPKDSDEPPRLGVALQVRQIRNGLLRNDLSPGQGEAQYYWPSAALLQGSTHPAWIGVWVEQTTGNPPTIWAEASR